MRYQTVDGIPDRHGVQDMSWGSRYVMGLQTEAGFKSCGGIPDTDGVLDRGGGVPDRDGVIQDRDGGVPDR